MAALAHIHGPQQCGCALSYCIVPLPPLSTPHPPHFLRLFCAVCSEFPLPPVPCPNCGSADLSIDCYDTMRYSYTYVQCNSCLRLVKPMDSREDTIQRWNDLAARYRKRRPKTPQ